MIRAGKLDRFITIERRHDSVSAAGSVQPLWTPHATVRAEIVTPELSERTDAAGTIAAESTTFRLRHLAGITPVDRVRYDGRTLNIVSVKEIGRRRGLDLRCEGSA
ncbi:MAG: phage head closure protein [Allorhizobium sp.]